MRLVYVVRTPENVQFEFERAGLASRFSAWVIDQIVIGALLIVLILFVVPTVAVFVGASALAVGFVGMFLLLWGYFAILEWKLNGRTLGKAALGLRVIQQSGVRMTFVQSVVRNLLRTVDLFPGGMLGLAFAGDARAIFGVYLVGAVVAFVDPLGRRLGDLAASTVVVRERKAPMPSAIVPAAERYNSFIGDPAVRAAARRITGAERDAMTGLALRRESLPLAVRLELFEKLSEHLQARTGLPRPAIFSAEKYVLNLTAVVLSADESRAD